MSVRDSACCRGAGAAWVALVLASSPSVSLACGACDEDSIAATYDHQVVAHAARAGDLVVYCRLEGQFDRQRLVSAARRVPGVRKDSIRVSAAPPALSFALNPALQTALTAVTATERSLPPRSRLRILEVVSSRPSGILP